MSPIPGRPYHVTATEVLAAHAVSVKGVLVGTAASGQTLTLYDCATSGAAGSSNEIAIIDLSRADSYHLWGAYFDNGLYVVVSGGTPDITIITD